MQIFDLTSLWIGRFIICSVVSFVFVMFAYLFYSYILQTFRFYSLLVKVNKVHKLKDRKYHTLFWYVFVKNGIELALMEQGTSWSGEYFYFSPNKMYIRYPLLDNTIENNKE